MANKYKLVYKFIKEVSFDTKEQAQNAKLAMENDPHLSDFKIYEVEPEKHIKEIKD